MSRCYQTGTKEQLPRHHHTAQPEIQCEYSRTTDFEEVDTHLPWLVVVLQHNEPTHLKKVKVETHLEEKVLRAIFGGYTMGSVAHHL